MRSNLQVIDGKYEDPPVTEPVIVECPYTNGAAVELEDGTVQIIGWVTVPSTGDLMAERRIVVRFAMSNAAARRLQAQLRKTLANGGH